MRGLALLVIVSACQSGMSPIEPPDGGADDGGSDPSPAPACSEFAEPGVIVPAHVTSTISGADVASPASCATVDAPFGTDSAGPDRVIPLRGLQAGVAYVVKLVAEEDLQFYVATGCTGASGPTADQCVLFVDASEDTTEVGRFVATGASAYVVVDYYASQPSTPAFTLDVYQEQCQDASQCSAGAPACFAGQCVECASSFDCANVAKPRCDDAAHTCTAGADLCASDDTGDPADDGPAGATLLVPGYDDRAVANHLICASPLDEADFFAFDVASPAEVWDLQLAWGGGRDLDLALLDATGATLGLSFWELPERVRLDHLAPGRYYIRVSEFASSQDSAPLGYTLTATRSQGAPCASAADCAGEFRNQLFRGRCAAGACTAIDGDGALGAGARCDSQSDCSAGLHCPSFAFVANADTRDVCAPSCSADTDCAPGFLCTTYLYDNFCVRPCTSDAQCPTALGEQPASGPWFRLSCDLPTGRCLP